MRINTMIKKMREMDKENIFEVPYYVKFEKDSYDYCNRDRKRYIRLYNRIYGFYILKKYQKELDIKIDAVERQENTIKIIGFNCDGKYHGNRLIYLSDCVLKIKRIILENKLENKEFNNYKKVKI